MGTLEGLVAVVTGGAGHLGSAMTDAMARQGASVVVADLDGARAAAHAKKLAADGLQALGLEVDVTSTPSVNTAFEQIAGHFGGVDILVNNAVPSSVIRQDGPVAELDLEVWDVIESVVIGGALRCSRAALGSMIERGGGSIVNIASIHGHAGDADLTAYPVAKAALLGLTRTLATQYGASGVRCNSVTLGTIPFPSMSEEARRNKIRHQLLQREGRPEDVAALVTFLSSPAAAFTTGADFLADGGVLAHLPSYADGGTFGLVRDPSSD
jgi:NAD(P)-dependent dehydrogenase (short-subunit alcohol dehydrogenase family)